MPVASDYGKAMHSAMDLGFSPRNLRPFHLPHFSPLSFKRSEQTGIGVSLDFEGIFGFVERRGTKALPVKRGGS